MANRSYLYTTDVYSRTEERPSVYNGWSEYNYGIPLSYMILASGNPEITRSRIWTEQYAVLGDTAKGVQNLHRFLDRLNLPAAQAQLDKTRLFIDNPANHAKYILLECTEIFMLKDASIEKQNDRLLKQIKKIDDAIERWLMAASSKGISLEDMPDEEQNKLAVSLGIDLWTSILYFDLTDSRSDETT